MNEHNKTILFLSAFPLAILTDIGRISSIFLVARFLSPRVGMYLWHDMAGYLVFMIAFLLLASISASIEDRAKKG